MTSEDKMSLINCFFLVLVLLASQTQSEENVEFFDYETEFLGKYLPTFTQEDLTGMKIAHRTSNDVDVDICKAGKQKLRSNTQNA